MILRLVFLSLKTDKISFQDIKRYMKSADLSNLNLLRNSNTKFCTHFIRQQSGHSAKSSELAHDRKLVIKIECSMLMNLAA